MVNLKLILLVSVAFALCNLVEIAIAVFFSQMRRWKEADKAENNTLDSGKSLASQSNKRNRK